MIQTDYASNRPAALHTRNLEVTYETKDSAIRALRRNSLTLAQGAFVVLLGASGAGKSTLLRTLNGLVRPTSGSVIAEGIGDLAERDALLIVRRFNAILSTKGHTWFWPKIAAATPDLFQHEGLPRTLRTTANLRSVEFASPDSPSLFYSRLSAASKDLGC